MALVAFARFVRGSDKHGIGFIGMLNGLDRGHDFGLLPPRTLGPVVSARFPRSTEWPAVSSRACLSVWWARARALTDPVHSDICTRVTRSRTMGALPNWNELGHHYAALTIQIVELIVI